jgi:hypothetical protein
MPAEPDIYIARPSSMPAAEPDIYLVVGASCTGKQEIAQRLADDYRAKTWVIAGDSLLSRFVWDVLPAPELGGEREYVVVTRPLPSREYAEALVGLLVRRYGCERVMSESVQRVMLEMMMDDDEEDEEVVDENNRVWYRSLVFQVHTRALYYASFV